MFRARFRVPSLQLMLPACLLGISLLLTALPASAQSGQSLTLAVSKSPLSLPLYVAQDRGFLAGAGISAKFIDCVGGVRCMKLMLDGQAELATASSLPVMFNGFERTDFAVLATMVSSSEDIKVITQASSNLASAKQLAGKRVGVVRSSASHFFMELYLITGGVSPRDVEVSFYEPEELSSALKSGKVDAIAAWEPFAFNALKELAPATTSLPSRGIYFETFNIVASAGALQKNAALVQLLKAVEQAEQYISDDPAGAKSVLKRRLGVEQDFIDAIWPSFNYRLTLDQALLSTMETQARWARREGYVSSKTTPNFLKLIHAAPLRTAKPGAVSVAQ